MAITLLQQAGGSSGYGTSLTVSLGAPSMPGTILVAALVGHNYSATWTLPSGWVNAQPGNNPTQASIWYYPNNPGGISSVTVTGSVSSYIGLLLFEFAGLPASPLDTAANVQGAATSATPSISSPATTASGDLVLAVFDMVNGNPSVAGGSSYTMTSQSTANASAVMAAEWLIAGSPATQTAGLTLGATSQVDAAIATFFAGAGLPHEQYGNQDSPPPTLSAGLTSSATSLTVSDATKYPAGANFRIRIDSEILIVTGVSGATFTVTRGAEGTAGAAHSSGASVYHELTEGSLLALFEKGHIRDLRANLPASDAALVGRLLLPSDGVTLQRDRGTQWDTWGPLFPLVEAVASAFSWTNQGGASLDASRGGLYLFAPQSGTSANVRILRKPIPQAAPWTITALLLPAIVGKQYLACGILSRESSTGKFCSLELIYNGNTGSGYQLEIDRWTNETTYSAGSFNQPFQQERIFLRIRDDGGSLVYSFSADGIHFIQLFSESRTAFMAGGPDQVGFLVSAQNNGLPYLDAAATLIHWAEAS